MVRGLYSIHDVEASKNAKKADSSYKSCLLTMFIVFLLCVIIFLVLWRTRTPSRNYPADDTRHERYAQQAIGTQPPYEVFTTSRKPTTKQHQFERYRNTNEKTTSSSLQTPTTPTTINNTTSLSQTSAIAKTGTRVATTSSLHTSPTALTGTTPVTVTDYEEYDFTHDIEFSSQENNTGDKQNANDRIVLSTATSAPTSTTTPLDGQQTSINTDSSQESSTSDSLIGGVKTLFNGTSVSSTISSTTSTIHGLQATSIDNDSHSSTNPTSISEQVSTTGNSFSDLESTTDQSVSDTVTHAASIVQTIPITSSSQHFTNESTTSSSGLHGAYFTTAPTLNDSSITTLSIVSSTDPSSTSSSTGATTNSLKTLHYGSHNTTIADTNVATTETTISSDDEIINMYSSSTEFSTTTNDTEDQRVCETNDCKVLTSRILSLMNHSIDPCDNFYEFACGGLRNNPTLLQDYPELDVWRRISAAVEKIDNTSYIAYQKFYHFYEQCVDYEHNLNRSERLVQARKIVRDIDLMYSEAQWQTEKNNFNLTEMLVKFFKINSAPLFDVLLDVDTHNPSKFQLKLTVPPVHTKLQLESPTAARCKATIIPDDLHKIDMEDIYNAKYRFCARNFSEYINNLETAVKELELFENTDDYSISQNIGYAKFFVEYDVFSVLENVAGWELKSNILEKRFNLMTVEELNNYYEAVEWESLFQSLLNTDSIGKDTPVQVYFQDEYFYKLFENLNGLLKSDNDNDTLNLHNGLLAMLAHDLYEDLIKPQPCNREDYCLRIASGLMEDIASSLYLSTFSKDELSERQLQMETTFHQLKDILKDNVHQANWLDDVSRSAVINKIDKMTVNANGGSTFFNNTSFLNNQLPSNHLTEENSFLQNSIQLLRRYRNILYNIYEGDPAEEINIWTFFILPFDTRPSAIYQLNTVVIPFGMTGSWKQSKNLPSYILKAQIGNEIARHIIHHFDIAGIKYGASGKDADFLTEHPNENYNAAYESCETNFDDFGRSWTNEHGQTYVYKVNALRTMNEHITDNSALWLTHKLFNKSAEKEPRLPWLNMNHDQLYFLLAAQEFCAKAELFQYTVQMHESEQLPPYLRVDNMVQNSPVFGQVYKCPVGGKQNPQVKCLPFPEMEEIAYKIPIIENF